MDSTAAQHLLKFGLVISFTLEVLWASALIKFLNVFAERGFIWIVAVVCDVSSWEGRWEQN